MSQNQTAFILLLALPLISAGFVTNAYSGFKGNPGSPMSGYHYHPAPIMIPPQVPPARFSFVWSTDEVIKLFEEHGLRVYKISHESLASHDILPVGVMELRTFTPSSSEEEWEGMILSFDLRDHLSNVRNDYLALNDSGKLYTWSFSSENILLVLPGTVPEETARIYERALYSLTGK